MNEYSTITVNLIEILDWLSVDGFYVALTVFKFKRETFSTTSGRLLAGNDSQATISTFSVLVSK
jgi:hypothetical protein